MNRLTHAIFSTIICAVTLVVGQLTSANVIYTYTGNDFNGIRNDNPPSGTYSTFMDVSGVFEIANPLPPNTPLGPITPLSYSFTDGRNVFTNSTPNLGGITFDVGTDALGKINTWDIGINQNYALPDQRAIGTTNSPGTVVDGGFISFSNSPTTLRDNGEIRNNPGIWVGPPPLSCSSILQRSFLFGGSNAIQISLSNYSKSNEPTVISATFTPGGGASLTEAEAACGVWQFDWENTITNLPSPSAFFAADSCYQANKVNNAYLTVCAQMTAPPVFNDPPAGGYDNSAGDQSFPFYYDPYNPQILYNPCLGTSKTDLECHEDDFHLYFKDQPYSPCFAGGANSPACNGQTIPPGQFIEFVTQLVGIDILGGVVPLGIDFTWKTNFNGGVGGVNAKNELIFDAGSGSGGITILTINGVPVSEPATFTVLGLGLAGLGVMRRRRAA